MEITSDQVQNKIKELKISLHNEFDEMDSNNKIYDQEQKLVLMKKLIENSYQIVEKMIGRQMTWQEKKIYF